MELKKIQGEFETAELAELAAGRIRRSVHGIRRMAVHTAGSRRPSEGKLHYTMLPANMRMQNYATAVMVSEMADSAFPEPMYRRDAKLTIICEETAQSRASAILQAYGAVKIQIL